MEKVDYTITDTMLSDMDAIMVELEVKTFGQEIKSVFYYVQAREMIYVIGYNAPVSEYESNLDIANKMLASFRLI